MVNFWVNINFLSPGIPPNLESNAIYIMMELFEYIHTYHHNSLINIVLLLNRTFVADKIISGEINIIQNDNNTFENDDLNTWHLNYVEAPLFIPVTSEENHPRPVTLLILVWVALVHRF